MAMKRPSPTSEVEDITEQPVKKAHRTHEENQERAYIAASRRTDRDIHHRLRSAKKASDCHRKRTGRGLKITYEAVLGDEQYESEEDDRPTRRYSMPTGSSASLTAGGAGAGLPNSSRAPSDHYDEIDALFAKSFPGVNLNPTWAAQQEQLQQRQQQQQQQFQQRQPQPHTHRHSYSHPYTPANGTAPAPAPAAAAGSGYTPRFKQRAPAPVHTHLQPQPSLVHSPHSPDSPYSPHSPHSAVHTPLSAVTPMSAISAYPPPPAHGGGGDGGKHASGIPHPTNGHGLGAALALLPLGANNAYPLDVDAGGSNGSLDGSPMVGVGAGEEAYYYSASAGSPDSPMGFGGAGGALGGALGGGGMIDFAGVGAEAAWLAGVDDGVGGNAAGPTGGEGAFYARRLSLPSALDQFHFPGGFESATTAAAPVAPEAMIDPSFLSSAAAVAPVAMPAAEEDVGGGGGGAAAADAAEPSLKEWMAEWVDFDEEAKL